MKGCKIEERLASAFQSFKCDGSFYLPDYIEISLYGIERYDEEDSMEDIEWEEAIESLCEDYKIQKILEFLCAAVVQICPYFPPPAKSPAIRW